MDELTPAAPQTKLIGYIALLVLLLFWAKAVLSDQEGASLLWSLLEMLTLVVHEAGHLLLYWSHSQFLYVLGGSLFQISFPLGATWYYSQKKQFMAVSLALFWLGQSAAGLSRYIGDARTQALDLVSTGGGEPMHDWHWILDTLNLLNHDTQIAGVVFLGAIICFGLGSLVLIREVIKTYQEINLGTDSK